MIIQISISILISMVIVLVINFLLSKPVLSNMFTKRNTVATLFLSVPLYFGINALFQSKLNHNIEYGKDFQNLPSYLSFFATLFSIYLLYRTLNSQNKSNNYTAFENRFFKFMDYHRENVNSLKYRDPKKKGNIYREGNEVFTIIYYEIKDLLNELKTSPDFFNNTKAKINATNFVFQCVFYGAGDDGIRILKKRFPDSIYWNVVNFENRKAKYSKKKVFYSGHVRRLGHYFRNIYQMVKYVEGQEFLTEKEKYEYVTHFRAQMSVYEQSVFFFNSLSLLGDVWELENYKQRIPETKDEKIKVFQRLLITKYDLVRNSLNNDGDVIDGFSISEVYPLITLERKEEFAVSGTLPFFENKKTICRICFNEKYIGYKFSKDTTIVREYFENNQEEVEKFSCHESGCIISSILKRNN